MSCSISNERRLKTNCRENQIVSRKKLLAVAHFIKYCFYNVKKEGTLNVLYRSVSQRETGHESKNSHEFRRVVYSQKNTSSLLTGSIVI